MMHDPTRGNHCDVVALGLGMRPVDEAAIIIEHCGLKDNISTEDFLRQRASIMEELYPQK
jgi:hypothetical protein